jgi:uncharacterized protein
MLVAIISDTHLPRGRRWLPARCIELIEQADAVLHAGDVRTADTLVELTALGTPLTAVYGNVDDPDLRERLPETTEVELGGARFGLIHNAGPAQGRLSRLRERFGGCDAVIFGHSHIPLHEVVDGFQIFNPGSPTDRRAQPQHTMGLARIEGGTIALEHVALGA